MLLEVEVSFNYESTKIWRRTCELNWLFWFKLALFSDLNWLYPQNTFNSARRALVCAHRQKLCTDRRWWWCELLLRRACGAGDERWGVEIGLI